MIGLIKGTMRTKKALAGLPLPIASFRTNGNSPLTACKVSISPVQAGSGDPSPSNPRPISGWDSVKVSATGKNLFKNTTPITGKYLDVSASEITYTGWNISDFIPIKEGQTYHFKPNSTLGASAKGWFYTEANYSSFISGSSFDSGEVTITAPSGARYVRFSYRDTSSDIQLETGSQATAYEPYNGQTATITLPHTVYGAEHDVLSGVGSETILGFNLKDISWTQNTYSQNIFNGTLPAKAKSQLTGYMAEEYKNTDNTSLINEDFSIAISSARTVVYVHDSRYNGVAEFIAGINSKMTYEVDTPTTYQAETAQLQARNGTNNVWADAGDISEIGYAVHQQYIGR